MTREALEQLDDRGISAWGAHDADAWAEIFAEDATWYDWTLEEPIRGKDAIREYFGAWMQAFPDMTVKRTDRVVGDDAVAGHVEFTGTNTGPMIMGGMEVPPTNRTVVGRGTYFAHVRDGKVVEFSSQEDVAGLMMQLGLMPSPS